MNEDILSLRLRPKTLSDVFGQDSLIKSLRTQMTKSNIRALMFVGASRCGKTTIARIIAAAVQCDHQKQWGDPCAACYDKSAQTITEINASQFKGVDDAEKIADMAAYSPIAAKRRIIILDEAQQLSPQAQNLLLKPFEDAPKTTIWIICTTAPEKIIAPLKNRCKTYKVDTLSVSEVSAFLEKAAKQTGYVKDTAKLAEAAVDMGVFAPGLLLNALENLQAGMSTSEALRGLGEERSPEAYAICKVMIRGDWIGVRNGLKTFPADRSRLLRATVAGFLRSMLFNERDPKKAVMLSDRLLEVAGNNAPLDDAMMLNWMVGQMYRITRAFRIAAK